MKNRILLGLFSAVILLTFSCSPRGAAKHYNLGLALKRQGKAAEAEQEFREAIRLKPNYAEAHNNLGNELASQGKLAEAIVEYREALRLKPGDDDFHYNLGSALLKQGDTEETIKEYHEASRLDPDKGTWDSPVHLFIGVDLRRLGKLEEAETEFRKAIRLMPDNNWALEELAALLDQQGKRKEARGYWERALKLEKRSEWVERIKKRLAEPD